MAQPPSEHAFGCEPYSMSLDIRFPFFITFISRRILEMPADARLLPWFDFNTAGCENIKQVLYCNVVTTVKVEALGENAGHGGI